MLPFDDLVSVCADFYSPDEVTAAATVIYEYVEQRQPAYKAPDKEKKVMAKLILNPNIALPNFVAMDITRLPPVGMDHLDVSALLHELSALRSEVRAITSIRMEMEQLKDTVRNLESKQSLRTSANCMDPAAVAGYENVDTPAFAAAAITSVNNLSTAQRLKSAIASGDMERVQQKSQKKVIVGKSSSSKIQAVTTQRKIDLFVSRVHPTLADSIIEECVLDALKVCPSSATGTDCAKGASVACEKLATKYNSYLSFHVTVTVDSLVFHDALDCLMSGDD